MNEGNNEASLENRVHALLKQRRIDEALLFLTQQKKEHAGSEREIRYLQAWCAIAQSRWEDAAEYLCSSPFVRAASEKEALLFGFTERRRRPRFMLFLGEIASELGHIEEAREHFLACLTMLDERRMNVPELRLQAQCDLGALSLQTGWPDQAVSHYLTALRLCGDGCNPTFQATLHKRLCEAYYQSEQFSAALASGERGLALLNSETETQAREELLLLLARVCFALEKFATAVDYAQEAWRLAYLADDSSRKAAALLTLADLFLKGNHTREARQYCQQALDVLQSNQDALLRGRIALLYGKIAEAEWHQWPDRAPLAEEAKFWYEQAQTFFTRLSPPTLLLTEVLERLALLLERRGSSEQALAQWKKVYLLASQQGRG